ncbi:Cystatin domain-containing protein [Cephalotus follicularis]|uniref:Cystatin domain-containing protein n=1 Tax=Cephalotus follicularis TaxID=3775 RepID=A0A1Q3B9W7_CEPFO|nr:Cystatin domain-containing protein [Cephalotus follicularis]
MAKPSMLLTLLLSCSVIATLSMSGTVEGFGSIVGGRTEVRDVEKNVEVQELGRFSVEEFNRSRNGGALLRFSRVVEAQKQVVSGIKYYLKIEATRNGEISFFDSVVVVKPWVHNSKELLHFTPCVEY